MRALSILEINFFRQIKDIFFSERVCKSFLKRLKYAEVRDRETSN